MIVIHKNKIQYGGIKLIHNKLILKLNKFNNNLVFKLFSN